LTAVLYFSDVERVIIWANTKKQKKMEKKEKEGKGRTRMERSS
jgi:hypothetical protein